jgi:primary-amine oxidase
MSTVTQAFSQTGLAQLHPFDPLTPSEIQLAVKILEATFPGVKLRYKRIDVQEPLKKDVIPYIEAERLGQSLPPRPARVLHTLFHRLDNGAFYKALINADTKSVIYAKEMPKHVQVCIPRRDNHRVSWANLLPL